MGLIERLKEWIEDITTGFETQYEKRFTKEQVEDNKINEAQDHQRQMAQGRVKDLERKLEMAEESEKQDRQKTQGQVLQDKKEKLVNEKLENHVSLRNLFTSLEEGEIEVGITNQNRNTTFGKFVDIIVDERGVLHVVEKTDDGETRVRITGATIGDIVQSPSGMITDIWAGYLPVNLTEEGLYMPSEETVKTPQIVATYEEGIVFSQNHRENYKKNLAEKQQRIRSLQSDLQAKEKALTEVLMENRDVKRQLERMETIARTEQQENELDNELVQNAVSQYRQQEMELNSQEALKEMWEKVAKTLVQGQNQSVAELMDEINKDEFDAKEEEIERILDMFIKNQDKMQEIYGSPSEGGGGGSNGGNQQGDGGL